MPKVLVIDDDPLVQKTLVAALISRGFTVDTAGDGDEGLLRFDSGQPDIVVTDIIMPNREGIETIIELRKRSPNIPILAISGGGRNANVDFLEAATVFGADKVLHKPFGAQEFIEAIKFCLAKHTRPIG